MNQETEENKEMYRLIQYRYNIANLVRNQAQNMSANIEKPKTEKQLKFEAKQAKMAQLQQEQEQKAKNKPKEEKKVASYLKEEKEEEIPQMDLESAIKYKQDYSKMKDKYDPKWVEQYWNQWWVQKKFFTPDSKTAKDVPYEKKFTMVVPPPNVTGSLHIGHGLTMAIEDCIVRWKRQQGYITEFLPGTDHAGIATQTVVEKQIWKTDKLKRTDLGREKFLEKVWEWKEKNGNHILGQFEKIGASFDWSRLAFTMDENLSKAVNEAFVRLHEQKLIYRANRLVNWSCQMKTAISDIEVDYIDIEKPIKMSVPGHEGQYDFGLLTSFAYKVKDSDEEMVVATTRIETMLGDVAVAVHSQDERYKHLIGKELVHPFISDRKVVIIADDVLVDMNFGTGAVKVTPGHDPRDFESGQRNNLPQINILDDEGLMNYECGPYQGMKRYDVRTQIKEDLKKLGLFRGESPNVMRLGLCSRSKDVIEPMLRPQWYVSMKEIQPWLIDVVKTKELRILPEEYEKNWFDWMTNLKDWCISRQIWWGHQCPAYLVSVEGSLKPADPKNENDWVVARNIEEAYQKAEKQFNVDRSKLTLKQDDDVLDTWFSSGLFPFSPFGWPDETNDDFKAFFPNSILETGHDILFFWVARMVMMSKMLLGVKPFHTVLLHPIVRDANGCKMSKSKGNVIDPLEIINGCSLENLIQKILDGNLDIKEQKSSIKDKEKEFPEGIPECGSDALRFGLIAYTQQGRNINLDVKRIIGYRQFCNKIWQSFKFVMTRFDNDFVFDMSQVNVSQLNFLNKWILHKLNNTVKEINHNFSQFTLGESALKFHQFWYYIFM